CDNQGLNILTAHLYMLKRNGELLEEPEGEKPIKLGYADLVYSDSIPKQIQYTALGHLHRFQQIGGHPAPVVYASSPLAYSYSEAGTEKIVDLIKCVANNLVEYRTIPFTAGRKLQSTRFKDVDSTILWLASHPETLVEITFISKEFLRSADIIRLHE